MIFIDKHIKNALHQCFGADTDLRQSQIARETGIQQASISRWISGLTRNMGDHNWIKIFPYIEKYLPEGYEPKDIKGRKKVFTFNHYNNVNVNSNNHNNIKELEKDHFEALLIKYFRTLNNDADKIKILGVVEEFTKKINK